MGPRDPTSKGKKYVLVCTCYVTKWLEEKAIPRAVEKVLVDFLFVDMECLGKLLLTKVPNLHLSLCRISLRNIRFPTNSISSTGQCESRINE